MVNYSMHYYVARHISNYVYIDPCSTAWVRKHKWTIFKWEIGRCIQ